MYKDTITKEELSLLPKEVFEGKITIVSSTKELDDAIAVLEKEKVIGFDTETKPSFVKGATANKVALMQLSTQDECFLIRMNKVGFPPSLGRLLINNKIKKIGISIKDDFHALRKRHDFTPEGFIDLQSIAANYGIEEKSLQKIYAIIFDKKISKSQRLSNWEVDNLTEAQQQYAAIDAWACLKIYQKLKNDENKLINI